MPWSIATVSWGGALPTDFMRAHSGVLWDIPLLGGRQDKPAEEVETADVVAAKGVALMKWVADMSGLVRAATAHILRQFQDDGPAVALRCRTLTLVLICTETRFGHFPQQH